MGLRISSLKQQNRSQTLEYYDNVTHHTHRQTTLAGHQSTQRGFEPHTPTPTSQLSSGESSPTYRTASGGAREGQFSVNRLASVRSRSGDTRSGQVSGGGEGAARVPRAGPRTKRWGCRGPGRRVGGGIDCYQAQRLRDTGVQAVRQAGKKWRRRGVDGSQANTKRQAGVQTGWLLATSIWAAQLRTRADEVTPTVTGKGGKGHR